MSQDKRTLKKFGIISSLIFGVIVLLSVLWIHLANNDLATTSSINIIILSSGIIGLSYCLFVLRRFDNKIDKEIFHDYDKLVREYKNYGDWSVNIWMV